MADILIINGTDNRGFKDDFFTPVTAPLVGELKIGNTVRKQEANAMNVLLGAMEKPIPRIDGQKLPIKFHNVKFTAGSISAGALENRAYIDAFDLKESIGYNVQNYDYSREDMLRFANLAKANPNLSPLADDIEKTQASINAYIQGYLPNHRLVPMITGSSMRKTIPALDNGTHGYGFQAGWARGEDYADVTTSNVDGDTVRNHYRVINGTAGTSLSTNDIESLAESIRSTDLFGQGNGSLENGVDLIALCHPSTINTLIKLSNDTANKDIVIFDGRIKARELMGIYFVPIQTFHKDFVVMYDATYSRELITHAVEYDEMQRGIAIIPKETVETFRTVWDVNGSQLRIFPEERHMFYRLAGGVLSVNKAHAETGGMMGSGSAGEIALNAWIAKIFKRFER